MTDADRQHPGPSSGLMWRQCVCGQWYWGAPQDPATDEARAAVTVGGLERPEDAAWVRALRDTPLYQCGHWLGDERICMLPHDHEKHTDEYAKQTEEHYDPNIGGYRRTPSPKREYCVICGSDQHHGDQHHGDEHQERLGL